MTRRQGAVIVATVGGLLAAASLLTAAVYSVRALTLPPGTVGSPTDAAPPVDPPRVDPVSPTPAFIFNEVAPAAGLNVAHFNAAGGRFRLVETMGGGVGVLDYDGDGWLDLVIAQGALIPADGSDRAYATQLYRNNRDGTFTDVAAGAGLVFPAFAQGVAVGDYDGDGDDDVFLSGFNAAALFRNEGGGRFLDTTTSAGLVGHGWGTSCAFADLDRDGDLDLYLVRYLADTVDAAGRPTVSCDALPGQIGYCPPLAFNPAPDSLYRNNGDGTFTDVAGPAGITRVDGNGLGLAVVDLDDDGRLDVFVANDKTPNQLFHNLGGLVFEEVGLPWGLAYNESGEAMAGMGVAVGDHDADGRPDLLVTNFYEEGVTLYRNAAPGRFEVVTARAGLRLPTRSKLGFGTCFADFDNDGALDLFIANGHVNDVRPLRMPYKMRPQLFRNDGQGRFSDASAQAGPYFRSEWLGRGAAQGDFDNDGDLDLVVTHNDAPPALLRNDTPGRGHALRLTLAAKTERGRPDRNPINARVAVSARGLLTHHQVVAGTSYLSRVDPRLLLGLGKAVRADSVEVRWPSGRVETWRDVPADVPLEFAEGGAPAWREVKASPPPKASAGASAGGSSGR